MYDLKTGSDSGREWIEVFNASDGIIHVPEWTLAEGGSDHGIVSFQGGDDLQPGAYAVLADNPSKFEADWPLYSGQLFDTAFSGGLSNSGESIAIGYTQNKAFVPIDTVVYTSAWGGSGDGNSLQRSASDATAFSGASPTPGAGTLVQVPDLHAPDLSASADTTSTATSSGAASDVATVSSYVPPPLPSLYADAGADRTIIVGADVEFDGRAYDKNQDLLDDSTTRFSWNFGDGATAEGAAVMHHFDYPGRYAVVLSIAENKTAVSDRIAVVAEPAALAFSVLPDGGVAIGNLSGHDLDLSHWIIRQSASPFSRQLILPEHSEILAGGSMHVGEGVLSFFAGQDTSLEYPNGVIAFGAGQASMTTSSSASLVAPVLAPASAAPALQTEDISPASVSSDTASDEGVSPEGSASEEIATSAEQTAATESSASSIMGGRLWWWIGAGVLAFVGGAALLLSRRAAKHEWDIEEIRE